jgi:hypothetical protein
MNNSSNELSISMLIDKDIKENTSEGNIMGYVPLPIKGSLNVDERKIYQWVPDDNVTRCNDCSGPFTFLIRKHHCRNCGKIFCHKCSDKWIKIPMNIRTVPKESNLMDYKTYLDMFQLSSDEDRVCGKCYNKIFELTELNKTIKIFDMLELNVIDYKSISCVCKSWNKIAKYYFSYFREIQYYFSDHIFTTKEINILYNNRHHIKGHSKWMLQLILSIAWDDDASISRRHDVLELLQNGKSDVSCWQMMCTRSCCGIIQAEDIIIILSKKYTYSPLIKFLIKELYNITDVELSCYMGYIVNLLTFYKNFSLISSEIENFLLSKTTGNIPLSNQLFWTITQCLANPDSYNYFSNLRIKLVKILSKDTYKLFQNGYDFTLNMIQLANNSTDNLVQNLVKHFKSYDFGNTGFYLPINFNKSFQSIDIGKICTIDSKTKPIILPCKYDTDKIFNIMLKKEDIRKEELIMKIIKLMDFFLKKEEDLDLFVTIYNILPISSEYGYIEFVQDSTTLYHIREGLKFSIQNYILEKNPDMSIHDLRDRLSKSCAVYCVITYLLGIGDRHLDNIMITNDGSLFHIDFGYILGNDPKPISPDIRLTPEMIDAMGGINSKYYSKFKNYCGVAYNCLRRHAPIFYVLLLNLTECVPAIDDNITPENIKEHIIQRFMPGENYKEAEEQFNHKIDKNSNTYSEDIIDYFHKQYKSDSTSNPLVETSANIVNKATETAYLVKNNVQQGIVSLSKMFNLN